MRSALMAPGALTLKYRFGALLADGTEFYQSEDDRHPENEKRTSFYELLEKDEVGDPIQHPLGGFALTRSDIALFQLEAPDGTRYVVDLRDGHFEVQIPVGRKLQCRPLWIKEPPDGQPLKLFYFRRRRHHANATGIVQEDLSVEMTKLEEVGQECEYHFGWETEDREVRAELILT
jgi:hypothetical protein